MKPQPASSGFALLLVLWTLVVLSTIALTLAATVGTEVRASQDSWNDLQAERLAKSGHELADYLQTRGLGTTGENLTGLPVEPIIPSFSYRVRLDIGTIELSLEGENGKLDITSSNEADVAGFFSVWTGNADRGRQIAASLLDWTDSDDDIRFDGAESSFYSANGYLPRNAGLGGADLRLIKGLTPADFFPSVVESADGVTVRNALPWVIATAQTGNRVNPNYAPPIVLQSIPGMTPHLLETILKVRRDLIFMNQDDFQRLTGAVLESSMMNRLTFDRGNTPAILSVGRLKDSSRVGIERRTHTTMRPPGWVEGMPMRNFVGLIERHAPIG